jgi:hypothetical protein
MQETSVTWVVVLIVALVGLATIVVLLRSLGRRRKPRIVIHEKSKLKIQAQGKKNCPACQESLDELPVARCKLDPSHIIHAQCMELVRNICPECKGQME